MAVSDMKSNANSMPGLLKVLEEIGMAHPPGRSLPPVDQWHPERALEIGLEIRSDGSWWHEGTQIVRDKLIRLFSTILRQDADGSVWLVTPQEKVRVDVEDAPFIAVRIDALDPGGAQKLVFTTNLGDTVVAGPQHPLRVETDAETLEPSPYVLVRGGLEARLSRAVFYALAELAEPSGSGEAMGVWSDGVFFEIGPAGEG